MIIHFHQTSDRSDGLTAREMGLITAPAQSGASKRQWLRAHALRAGQGKGRVLAPEVHRDGWEAAHFNPDDRRPNDGKTEHSHSATQVARGRPDYGIQVDHQVIN